MVIPSNGEKALADVKVMALLSLLVIALDGTPLYAIPPIIVQLELLPGWTLIKLAPLSADTTNVPLVSVVVKNFIII
jgi:hypothetical protein